MTVIGEFDPGDTPEPAVPENLASPTISGTAAVDEILTGGAGEWSEDPTSYSFQWYADDVAISGATSLFLALTEALRDALIKLGVIATNAVGPSEEAFSEAVGPVEGEPSEEITAPVLTLVSGAKLSTDIDTVDNKGARIGDFFELRVFTDDTLTEQVPGSPEIQEFLDDYVLAPALKIEWDCLEGLAPGTYYGDLRVVRDPDGDTEYSDRSPAVSGSVWTVSYRNAADGDSITAGSSSYAGQWGTEHPWVEFENFAVGGSMLTDLADRVEEVMLTDPDLVTLFGGANDLGGSSSSETPAEWVDRYFAICAAYKAAKPGIIIGLATILPCDESAPANAGKSGFNARRAIANPLIAAGVGTHFDFLIPFGEAFSDEDALDTEWADDGLHPTAATQTVMKGIYTTALLPFTPAEPDIGVVWASVTGINKSQYVASDGLAGEVTADNANAMGVRATAEAVPDKFQFEATMAGFGDAVLIGIVDEATALGGPPPPEPGTFPRPGWSSVPGFTAQMAGGWDRMQLRYNNDAPDEDLPGTGNPAVGDTVIVRCDKTTGQVRVYYMREADVSATLVFSVTLTTTLPDEWFAYAGGLMSGDAWVANFGSAPFRMALSDGYEAYRGS